MEHTLTRVASRRGPQPWGSQPPRLSSRSHIPTPCHMWPRGWGAGLQPQEPLSAQPPVHVYSSRPGPLPVGEGSWERGHGRPTRKPFSLGTMMSLTGWEGPGVGSWKEAGTLQGLEPWPSSTRRATTSAFCFFPAHFLTDSKVKSKTWTQPPARPGKKTPAPALCLPPPRLTPPCPDAPFKGTAGGHTAPQPHGRTSPVVLAA